VVEEMRGVDDLWREFDDVDACHRMTKGSANGDAAAQTDDGHLARVVVQQQRQMRQQLLCQHVAAVRRIHFAIDR
jgi:hypothetical protein